MDEDKVTCFTCGFLAKRPVISHGYSRESHEVFHGERERPARALWDHTTQFPYGGPEPGPDFDLYCYRGAAALDIEMGGHRDIQVNREKAVYDVIRKPRVCEGWFGYLPGLDPKEHLLELRRQQEETRQVLFHRQLEEDRRDFALQLDNNRKFFELKLDQERKASSDRDGRIFKWLGLLALALAIVQALLALGQLTSDSVGYQLLWGKPPITDFSD